MADHEDTVTPVLSDAQYNAIRSYAQRVIPALATFYGVLATIFNWPFGTEAVTIGAALVLLLGVVMSFSKASFQKAGGHGTIDTVTGQTAIKASALKSDTIILTPGSLDPKDASQ